MPPPVVYTANWDSDMVYGCLCHDGFYGADCSQRTNASAIILGGSFTLSFRGQTTVPINSNDPVDAMTSKLQAISTITQVLVLFSSTATTACPPGGNVIVVEFVQDFGPLPLLVGNPSNLVYTNVGGSVALTVARLQVGNKENLPCSNRGTCDVTSVRGICACYDGYTTSDGKGGWGIRGDCGGVLGSITACPASGPANVITVAFVTELGDLPAMQVTGVDATKITSFVINTDGVAGSVQGTTENIECAGRILPQAGPSLLQNGYAVMDNAFHPSLAQALKAEIQSLRGDLYANSTHVFVAGKDEPLLLEKDHIHEMELLTVPPSHAHLNQWFHNPILRESLNSAIPSLEAARHMIKVLTISQRVQFNEGHGGCFPMHFDTYGDDGKCLTAILYLNEEWVHGHGGELELFPFPHAPVTIAPLFNRLVLFSYCLTTWLYRSPQATSSPPLLPPPPPLKGEEAYHRMLRKLMISPFRRHLAKLRYADAWKQSLVASHKPTPAFHAYLDTFHDDIAAIDAATLKMLKTFAASKDTDKTTFPMTPAAFLRRLHLEFQGTPKKMSPVPWWH
ncbi:hypothetical protein DYB37_007545 [Aphanomyces astaci]|uniref:Prolyl 4-hydroxylase alpha subunit Fe(2+) 2OG dioxygenase domain-containing protein n=1 Tax=Aphanomyces astaci TaxID=112090 RepID=A0A418F3T9_APHAT|nr:hypothetical protein DYB35_005673 [Aphanomyces astaci]RHZ23171.1 hypothetical protein DYB37_007545 [Aphanomyces astaci]